MRVTGIEIKHGGKQTGCSVNMLSVAQKTPKLILHINIPGNFRI